MIHRKHICFIDVFILHLFLFLIFSTFLLHTSSNDTHGPISVNAFSILPTRVALKTPKRYHDSNAVLLSSKINSSGSNSNQIEEKWLTDVKFMERTKHWIVLVDDEEAIRLAVGDYLYDQGYQVTACADADALLEILHFDPNDIDSISANKDYQDYYEKTAAGLAKIPDVIISDIRMPGKDGLELVKVIRSDERLSRVPIVLLTAKSLTQDRILGYQAGADVYLPKPFDPDELLAIVDNVIRRRREMAGDRGKLIDLKDDMADIKYLLKRNANFVVKETDVYLTPTEREVLELLCKGFSNIEIAQARNVSKIGVNRYIQKLYSKTDTRTRTELVRWAIKTGQIARNSLNY